MMRQTIWVNDLALFRRKCEAPGHAEELISRYPPESRTKVYDHEYWWSDKWSPLDYGREYDFSKPFFGQYHELLLAVPRPNVNLTNSVNCDYCLSATNAKNCYLVSGGYFSQDCMYSDTPALSKDCVDVSICIFCETLYESFSCIRSFNLFYGVHCIECIDSRLMYDCRNCSKCFGCVGLRNKKYHIFNKPYSKTEYEKEMAKIDLGSHKVREEVLKKHRELVLRFPRKYMTEKNTVNCTGDNIENAKNCQFCFEIRGGAENCKYVLLGGLRLKDSYDIFAGAERSELMYESEGIGCHNVLFGGARESFNIQYSGRIFSSSNLFGCVGLRNKEYCILNKQYTKEEYEKLVPKIIEHMKAMPYVSKSGAVYRYGEFFPPEFGANAYNDSLAHEYFPLTKEEVLAKGLRWRDIERKEYGDALEPERLPDHIRDARDDIVEKVIVCGHGGRCAHNCKGAFKIIQRELDFYRKSNLPLPRLCPDCRHHERVEGKRLYELWHRKCACLSAKVPQGGTKEGAYQNVREHFHGKEPCPNEFETPYAPERPEIVYCGECYNAEVA